MACLSTGSFSTILHRILGGPGERRSLESEMESVWSSGSGIQQLCVKFHLRTSLARRPLASYFTLFKSQFLISLRVLRQLNEITDKVLSTAPGIFVVV